MSDEQIPCKQCGRLFTPVNRFNVFHTQQCRWDHRNQRTAEESRKREETGFAWDPIRPAAGVKISTPKQSGITTFNVVKGWKTAVILPDQQFGYRRYPNGDLDPFHDPRAVEVSEKIVEAERPDQVVMLGDINDLAEFGRFRQEKEFVSTTQPGLDRSSVHILTISELTELTVAIKGNHDMRIELFALDNAFASAGLRNARRTPGDPAILTVESLMGTKEMRNVEWVQGYPSGAHYLNDNVACIHGRAVGANLIEKVIDTERVTTIMGHVHRYFDGMKTFNLRGRPSIIRAHSPGCLCRIDGAVPSAKSGKDHNGKPAKSWENWQQGLTIVRYLPDGTPGTLNYTLEHIFIYEGNAMHRGQIFNSDKDVDDPEYALIPLSARL